MPVYREQLFRFNRLIEAWYYDWFMDPTNPDGFNACMRRFAEKMAAQIYTATPVLSSMIACDD